MVWNGITKAAAMAQALFNAVLAANPIMLAVMAIAALAAGLVVAYKKSETFRNAIQAAGRIGQSAIQWVISKVSGLIGFIGRLISRAGGIGGAFRSAMNIAKGAVNLLLAPLRGLINLISSVVNWISRIRFPSPPAWMSKIMGHAPAADVMGIPGDSVMRFIAPPAGLMGAYAPEITAARTNPFSVDSLGNAIGRGSGRVRVDNSVHITVDGSGVVDPRAVAEKIRAVLREDSRTRGLVTSGAKSWA